MDMLTKKSVPMDLLLKGPEEQKVSKEEENTFILQVNWKWKNFKKLLIMTNRCFWKSLHLQYVWLFIAGHTTRHSRGLECISSRSKPSTWISNCGTPCDSNHQRHHVCLLFHSSYDRWPFLLAISCSLLTTSNQDILNRTLGTNLGAAGNT